MRKRAKEFHVKNAEPKRKVRAFNYVKIMPKKGTGAFPTDFLEIASGHELVTNGKRNYSNYRLFEFVYSFDETIRFNLDVFILLNSVKLRFT